MLNSNSWTKNQINKVHHDNQLKWLEGAFHDPECSEYLINAHVPLGWLEQSRGHHNWTNLEGAVHSDYARPYRDICDRHAKKIVAELYGHINKVHRLVPLVYSTYLVNFAPNACSLLCAGRSATE